MCIVPLQGLNKEQTYPKVKTCHLHRALLRGKLGPPQNTHSHGDPGGPCDGWTIHSRLSQLYIKIRWLFLEDIDVYISLGNGNKGSGPWAPSRPQGTNVEHGTSAALRVWSLPSASGWGKADAFMNPRTIGTQGGPRKTNSQFATTLLWFDTNTTPNHWKFLSLEDLNCLFLFSRQWNWT